jgi:ferric-dicitrate binding protein FerR (iron transport regulator)
LTEESDPREPELETFLRGVPPQAPDPIWREEVRGRFLARASRAAGEPRMTQPMPSQDPTDSDLERWLRGLPVLDAAPPEARERARRRFLTAALSGPEAAPGPAGAPLARGWRRWLVPALAAAAIALVTWILPAPDRWRVDLAGTVHFADAEYGAGDEGRLALDLEQAGVLEARDSEVRLRLGDALELLVRAGTRIDLPPLPVLDGSTPIALVLERGEVYLRTASGYAGNPILVSTADGQVEVLGTTLGVLCEAQGTCVCVREGAVSVRSPRLVAGLQRLPAGEALFLFRDARAPLQGPFEGLPEGGGEHVADLAGFHASPRR